MCHRRFRCRHRERRLRNLTYLSLQDNQITEIQGLNNLTNLRTLILSNNKLTTIEGLQNLKKLENLDLSGNFIKEISGLDNLPNLKQVNLQENEISTEDFPFIRNPQAIPEFVFLKSLTHTIYRFIQALLSERLK